MKGRGSRANREEAGIGGKIEDSKIGGKREDAKNSMFFEINVVELGGLRLVKRIFVGAKGVVH